MATLSKEIISLKSTNIACKILKKMDPLLGSCWSAIWTHIFSISSTKFVSEWRKCNFKEYSRRTSTLPTVAIISALFLGTTVFVYIFSRDLRSTAHGKSELCLVLSILLVHSSLPFKGYAYHDIVFMYAPLFVLLGFSLSSLWMSVLSFDILRTVKYEFTFCKNTKFILIFNLVTHDRIQRTTIASSRTAASQLELYHFCSWLCLL